VAIEEVVVPQRGSRRAGPRTRAVPEKLFGPTPLPSPAELAFRPEPAPDLVDASAPEAPLLGRLRRLVQFLGDGRLASSAGTVTLDDARVLVPLLGTSDVIDWQLGNHVFPTTSATRLPDLHATISLSKRTGVVRVLHGRLVPTKKGRAFERHALDVALTATDVLVGVGPLQLRLGRRFGSPLQHWIDERSVYVLRDLHRAGGSVAFDDLVDDWSYRYEEIVDEVRFRIGPHYEEQQWEDFEERWTSGSFALELSEALEAFELCGVIRRDGSLTHSFEGLTSREAGDLSITPLGESLLWSLVWREQSVSVARARADRIESARRSAGGSLAAS
jgi:hypothetical protein